jgi:hypothetical protein
MPVAAGRGVFWISAKLARHRINGSGSRTFAYRSSDLDWQALLCAVTPWPMLDVTALRLRYCNKKGRGNPDLSLASQHPVPVHPWSKVETICNLASSLYRQWLTKRE